MRAVNLIPSDSRSGRSGPSIGFSQAPAYVIVGMLVAAVGLAAVYVLTNNKISDRRAQLTSLKAEVADAQAAVGRLGNYVQFEQLAQTRVQTVRQLASARFNWHDALSDVSRVVPANTSLQTLSGSVLPTTGGGAGGSGLRSAITAPAFELTGCTRSQDDVARLMSRLRLVGGVTRVTLSGSQEASSAQGGVQPSAPASGAGSSSTAQGCGAKGPTFDLLVFFQPVPGAGPDGASSITGATATSTSTGAAK